MPLLHVVQVIEFLHVWDSSIDSGSDHKGFRTVVTKNMLLNK